MAEERITTSEAVAKLVWALAHGESFGNDEAAVMAGLTPHGAYTLLCRVSRIIPIYQDDEGHWQVLALRELV